MTGNIRGQLVFRRCAGNSGRDVDVGIGILEAHPATFPAFRNHDLMIDLAWKRNKMTALPIPGAARTTGSEYATSDLAGILCSLEYPRGANVAGGTLIVRTTRLTSTMNLGIYVIALVVEAGGKEIDRKAIHELKGDGTRFSIQKTEDRLPFEPNGMSLCQIHRSSIWGWEEEKWGPVSTMRLDVLDICNQIDELRDKDERNEAENQKLHDLRRKLGWDPTSSGKDDPQYIAFRKQMIAQGYRQDWAGRNTETREREISAAASKIIQTLMAA